jgi:beta-lactamase class A
MRSAECVVSGTSRTAELARRVSLTLVCLAVLLPALGLADEVEEEPGATSALEESLRSRDAGLDPAPLWDMGDAALQAELEAALGRLGLVEAVQKRQLCLALVDINEIERPRVAAVNGDVMMYAASLPKIAVLLAAFEMVERGELLLDDATRSTLELMIRRSSNRAATQIMHRVGKASIAEVLVSPRYRLYDPEHNGGLWVGKDYAKGGLWRRDPLRNLSHAATAMQVARFYYLLETGQLVSPEHSENMKEILTNTQLRHKFAKALIELDPDAKLYRKSGSWRTYHSDSVLVKDVDRAYIAVALINHPEGSRWLVEIARQLDAFVSRRAIDS